MELELIRLKDYVKTVAGLESSVFSQKKTRGDARESLRKITAESPKKKDIGKKPVLEEVKKPVEPAKPTSDESRHCALGVVSFLFGGGLVGCGFAADSEAAAIIGAIVAFIGIIVAITNLVWLNGSKKDYATAMKKYVEDSATYPQRAEKANNDYKRKLSEYTEKSERNDKEYEEKTRAFNEMVSYAQNSVAMLDAPLEETEKLLQEAYNLDVIHPKYRNLVAMSSFLEYFETGRCTELTGPNGAYNLYESETRQNLIINHLETVITKLDQIKENQYTLYSEVQKANQISAYIASMTQSLAITAKRVEAYSALTAYCTEISALNTGVSTTLQIFNS